MKVSVNYPYIKAIDEQGKSYIFGTNLRILRDDVIRFSKCDLSRYPVGELLGRNNKVDVLYVHIVYDDEQDYPSTCPDYLRFINAGGL